jgi:hypothetical protein
MSDKTTAMHQAFLLEIREKRRKLAEEDAKLELVEQYHLGSIPKHSTPITRPVEAIVPANNGAIAETSLDGLKRYEACVIALRAMGGRQKTAEITNWLLEKGAGGKMEPKVFFNAVYTAMNRRKEIFRKTKGGWELLEGITTEHKQP